MHPIPLFITGQTMFLVFFTSLVATFALLRWEKAFSKKAWTIFIAIFIVLACATSFLLAYVSVASVWTPHPLSDDVFRQQNALGEYEGMFPLSKLSYPLYLRVYHTPVKSQILENGTAHGQVFFSVFFAAANVIRVSGVFWCFYQVMGPVPLHYKIDFLFSDSPEFFGFLVTLFTFVNIIGALLGVILAKTLHEKVHISR
jgi:hypothetical protein